MSATLDVTKFSSFLDECKIAYIQVSLPYPKALTFVLCHVITSGNFATCHQSLLLMRALADESHVTDSITLTQTVSGNSATVRMQAVRIGLQERVSPADSRTTAVTPL